LCAGTMAFVFYFIAFYGPGSRLERTEEWVFSRCELKGAVTPRLMIVLDTAGFNGWRSLQTQGMSPMRLQVTGGDLILDLNIFLRDKNRSAGQIRVQTIQRKQINNSINKWPFTRVGRMVFLPRRPDRPVEAWSPPAYP
jgi:hypothetical protein